MFKLIYKLAIKADPQIAADFSQTKENVKELVALGINGICIGLLLFIIDFSIAIAFQKMEAIHFLALITLAMGLFIFSVASTIALSQQR